MIPSPPGVPISLFNVLGADQVSRQPTHLTPILARCSSKASDSRTVDGLMSGRASRRTASSQPKAPSRICEGKTIVSLHHVTCITDMQMSTCLSVVDIHLQMGNHDVHVGRSLSKQREVISRNINHLQVLTQLRPTGTMSVAPQPGSRGMQGCRTRMMHVSSKSACHMPS